MTDAFIQKSAATEDDMKKISTFTRREMSADEVYTFNVDLCNNDVDRDFEKFSVQTLNRLAKLFVGKTGIFDHSMKANDQKARVFDAYVEKIPGRKTADGEDFYTLKAKAYMLNNEENKSLIDEIDAGIKKEVSISCSADKSYCSICNTDNRHGRCEHIKGKTYGGKLCFNILSDATDAYEFSFVAVPAQREAGITKSFLNTKERKMQDIIKTISSGENVTLTKSEADRLYSYIETLEGEAALGEEYKKSLSKEVVDLFKSAFPDMDAKLFSSVTAVMTTKELLGFRDGMKKSNAKSKIKPQLATEANKKTNDFSQFRI